MNSNITTVNSTFFTVAFHAKPQQKDGGIPGSFNCLDLTTEIGEPLYSIVVFLMLAKVTVAGTKRESWGRYEER